MAKNHNAKNCQQRLICRLCTVSHPTILHGYVPKVKTDNNQSIATLAGIIPSTFLGLLNS